MKQITLNTSVKAHLLLGVFVALWLVLFQVLIAPFDIADLSFKVRLLIIPPYGLITAGCYMLMVGVQNLWFGRDQKWNLLRETSCLLLLYAMLLPACWAYYTTDLVNGTFPFEEFALFIFLPIAVIFSAFIIMGRMYLNNLQRKKHASTLALKGDNRDDILKLKPEQFVAVSSAQNYVEVHYLFGDELKKELLRMSLKKVADSLPHLLQVHRSHLINPEHFVRWSDSNAIQVNELILPVSQTYKASLEEVL